MSTGPPPNREEANPQVDTRGETQQSAHPEPKRGPGCHSHPLPRQTCAWPQVRLSSHLLQGKLRNQELRKTALKMPLKEASTRRQREAKTGPVSCGQTHLPPDFLCLQGTACAQTRGEEAPPSFVCPLHSCHSTGSEDYRDSSDQGKAEDRHQGGSNPPEREGITEQISEDKQGSEQARQRA